MLMYHRKVTENWNMPVSNLKSTIKLTSGYNLLLTQMRQFLIEIFGHLVLVVEIFKLMQQPFIIVGKRRSED